MPRTVNQAMIMVMYHPDDIPLAIGPFESMQEAENFEKENREDLKQTFKIFAVEMLTPENGKKSFLMDKVYALMEDGLTNREIAKKLGVKVGEFSRTRLRWWGWSKPGQYNSFKESK